VKIIGRSDGGVLVDITTDELAKLMGYPSQHNDAFTIWARSQSVGAGIRIGTEIPFVPSLGRLRDIQQHESRARDCARMLKALGDMIEGALPSTMIPPATPIQEETLP
jgi:purine nucleoside phosphorylase